VSGPARMLNKRVARRSNPMTAPMFLTLGKRGSSFSSFKFQLAFVQNPVRLLVLEGGIKVRSVNLGTAPADTTLPGNLRPSTVNRRRAIISRRQK
jgi:hypothetical protein